jgi:hypothetical protein
VKLSSFLAQPDYKDCCDWSKETSEDFFDRVSAKLYSVEQEVLNSAEGESERKAMIRYRMCHGFRIMKQDDYF